MNKARTILVGVDGSEGSINAVRWALREARLRNDTVEVIHSWHVPTYGYVMGAIPYPIDVMQDSASAVISAVLEAVTDDICDLTIASRVDLGQAAPTLIDASKNADLLVVGRRGHGGFVSLVMGSVAQQVAAHAHCPVVIVAGE